MTDPQQIHANLISVKKVAISLLAAVVIGSIAGFAAWSQLLTDSQGIAIASIGKFGPSTSIEEPQSFIERIKSPAFAGLVSARAGIPELAMLLPAAQYGGSGAISARSLRDPNLVEIRVNLPQPELALKAVTAAIDELIADHEAKITPLIQNFQSSIKVLDKRVSEMIETNDTITKGPGGPSQREETGKDNMALLSARALTESGIAALIKSVGDLRAFLSHVRRTQAIAAPTVLTPRTASLYRILGAGALAGLLAGLLLLQMFPGFFRDGRPGTTIIRTDTT